MKKLWGTKNPRLPGRLARSLVSILHDLLRVLELQKNKIFILSFFKMAQVGPLKEKFRATKFVNTPERVVITST